LRSLLLPVFLVLASASFAQLRQPTGISALSVSLPDAQQTQTNDEKTAKEATTDSQKPPPQPKRILGIMPNYRAVSAGVIPPPPTPKEAFKIATKNSFDYSAFVFVGLTPLIAEGNDSHPQLGKGVGGF